jgi:hypothetical protein
MIDELQEREEFARVEGCGKCHEHFHMTTYVQYEYVCMVVVTL